ACKRCCIMVGMTALVRMRKYRFGPQFTEQLKHLPRCAAEIQRRLLIRYSEFHRLPQIDSGVRERGPKLPAASARVIETGLETHRVVSSAGRTTPRHCV